jgi:hypothetical protein
MRARTIRAVLWIAAFAGGVGAGGFGGAAHAQVERASAQEKRDAKAGYAEGKKAFVAGDYNAALAAFQGSYGAVASPNTRLMIARSLTQLHRYAEACRIYEETLEEAEASGDPKWKKAAKAALEEQTELLSRVGLLLVRVGGDRLVTLTVNGHVVPEDQWERPIPVEPGAVEIAIDDGAGQRAQKSVDVSRGEQVDTEIALRNEEALGAEAAATGAEDEPDEDDSGPPLGWSGSTWRTAGWVATGVGAVGVGLFAAFGAMSQSTYDDLNAACPTRIDCDPSLADDIDSGSTQQTVANVSLGVGAVALTAGAAALWIGFSQDDDAGVAFGPGTVTVRGTL